MIRRRGNSLVLSEDIFKQLETRHHFPFELLNKDLAGYVYHGVVYIIYREREALIRVPFARNRLWYRAIMSDPGFSVLSRLSQIYIVSKRD